MGPKEGKPAPVPEAARKPRAMTLEMPGELVLVLRVPLPLASQRQRQAAVPFAIEDLVAEPIEALHVALGPEIGPGEYLVGVARHEDMAEWAPRAASLGQALVPDTLSLPVPAEGSWAVREIDGRVLARLPDGTGFATDAASFETFWRAGSQPQIVLFGGRLPPALPVGATALSPAHTGESTLDLLQGAYAPTQGGWLRLAPRFLGLTAVALAAHLVVLAVDTHWLRGLADAREAELRGVLAERLGTFPATLPLDAAVRRALPAAEAESPRLLPLLVQVSEALAPLADQVGFRSLGYDAETGAVALTLEAGGLGTIQRAERELAGARLAVSAGAAVIDEAGAEARFVIGSSE